MFKDGDPFDKTVWDPENPEQAIEDPLHGPTALHDLLKIPPMRLADGTYHVFGGFYLVGTNSFDAEGKPFVKFKTAASGFDLYRETQEMQQWVEAFHNGELPPREEMELPEFQYSTRPYYLIEGETLPPIGGNKNE